MEGSTLIRKSRSPPPFETEETELVSYRNRNTKSADFLCSFCFFLCEKEGKRSLCGFEVIVWVWWNMGVCGLALMDKTVTTLFKSKNDGCYSRKLIVYINISHTKEKKVKHPMWQILAFCSKTDLQELAWRVLGVSTAFWNMWSNILACIIKWVETPGQFRKSCLPGKKSLYVSIGRYPYNKNDPRRGILRNTVSYLWFQGHLPRGHGMMTEFQHNQSSIENICYV